MSATYQTAPPLCIRPGLSREEANAPIRSESIPPDTTIVQMTGELAEVGEYAEMWWAARLPAFSVDTDGKIQPELRRVILRLDTLGAVVKRMQHGHREWLEVDWTISRDILRNKGWLRVDPVLKELGIHETGVLSDAELASKEYMDVLSARFIQQDVMDGINALNGTTWRPAFRQRLRDQLERGLRVYLSGLGAADRAVEARPVLETLGDGVDAVRVAMGAEPSKRRARKTTLSDGEGEQAQT